MRPITRCSVALLVSALLVACDRVPTSTQPSLAGRDALLTLHGGTADVGLTASATILQNGDSWTLAKSGSLSGSVVTWTITATKTTVVNGQLLVEGQVTLTNSGDGPATIGNVVVNLQQRVTNKWVTKSSDIANATQGDAATTASIHQAASSEDLGTFAENSASGALEFRDATTSAVVSLVPQLLIDAAEARTLLFSAAFDNSDAALQLTAGTPIRAEVIVTFGNATVNGNSTANVDINGNGAIDGDEAHVRSVSSRLALTVPAAAPGGAPTLTDALADITVTGDATFSNAQFTIGATTGTVTATVDGGANGGSITNCAHLTSNGNGSVDIQACGTVDVAAEPPDCTPGVAGCGWAPGDMLTFAQFAWGDGSTPAGVLLSANYNTLYGGTLIIGGTFFALYTSATAVFTYLPALGSAGSLTASVQNPASTSSGELGGEVLALRLNVDFSAASLLGTAFDLGSLRFCNYSDVPALNNQTVSQFLATANNLLGGGGAPFGAVTAAVVASQVNSAFINGVPSAFAQANLVAGPSCGWQSNDLRTATQEQWGDPASSAGSILQGNFSSIYVNDLVVGGNFTLTLTTASAVFTLLPSLTPAATLNSNVQDPQTTSAGELATEIVALRLNADFSSLLGNSFDFGSLRICNFSSLAVLNGQTVNQFLATANHILGGGSASFGPTTAATVARNLNAAFANGIPSSFAQASLVAGACPS